VKRQINLLNFITPAVAAKGTPGRHEVVSPQIVRAADAILALPGASADTAVVELVRRKLDVREEPQSVERHVVLFAVVLALLNENLEDLVTLPYLQRRGVPIDRSARRERREAACRRRRGRSPARSVGSRHWYDRDHVRLDQLQPEARPGLPPPEPRGDGGARQARRATALAPSYFPSGALQWADGANEQRLADNVERLQSAGDPPQGHPAPAATTTRPARLTSASGRASAALHSPSPHGCVKRGQVWLVGAVGPGMVRILSSVRRAWSSVDAAALGSWTAPSGCVGPPSATAR
jgi:hypothetical protein